MDPRYAYLFFVNHDTRIDILLFPWSSHGENWTTHRSIQRAWITSHPYRAFFITVRMPSLPDWLVEWFSNVPDTLGGIIQSVMTPKTPSLLSKSRVRYCEFLGTTRAISGKTLRSSHLSGHQLTMVDILMNSSRRA